jgi:hypothetical protein
MTDKLETIVSLIASSGSACYPYERPNGVSNCIVYMQISDVPIRSMSGNLGSQTRVQITIFNETLAGCKSMAMSVKNLLDLNTKNFILSWNIEDIITKNIGSGLFQDFLDFYIL